ncbi:hypothetical protein, partial [Thiopseudomonas acetoxidans]
SSSKPDPIKEGYSLPALSFPALKVRACRAFWSKNDLKLQIFLIIEQKHFDRPAYSLFIYIDCQLVF